MADPTKYVPGYSYTGFQDSSPTVPLPADEVDNDLAQIASSNSTIVEAIKDIRRSDGALKNRIVSYDSLSANMKARLAAIGFTGTDEQLEALFGYISSLTENAAPSLADMEFPHSTVGGPRKVGGEKLAELILASTAMDTTLSGKDDVSEGTLQYLIGLAGGVIKKLPIYLVTPFMFGAVGDGVADDTASLNTLIAEIRALIVNNRYVKVKIDLGGGVYKITGSGLNMTGLQCWNLEVCNGVLLGHTTGKAVVDLTGSRGYAFRNVLVNGDQSDMPTLPFLCARATSGFTFCDNNLFDNVTAIGFFSVAAHYAYAQETTTHTHCRYWNYNFDASIAIFEGSPLHPQTSDFKTVISGGQSFINCKYINCDFRYLPSATTLGTITHISNSNPIVVTCDAGHPFVNGESVIIAHISTGMLDANSVSGVVANVTGTSFELVGVDSTPFMVYTSGGSAVKMSTQPAIFMNRMKQHDFDTCYLVTYGEYGIQLEWTDGFAFEHMGLDFLIEGANSLAHYYFRTDGSIRSCVEMNIKAYATHTRGSFLSTDSTPGSQFNWYGGSLEITSNFYKSDLDVFNSPADFALVGVDVILPLRSCFSDAVVAAMATFRGTVTAVDDGRCVAWGADIKSATYSDPLDGAFTPTITAASGTITSVSGAGSYVRYLGNMVFVSFKITITTNGAGSGQLRATLPAAASANGNWVLNGRGHASSGQQMQGMILGSSPNYVSIVNDDNGYPGVDGETIYLSGWYEKA